jgi:hypothetical protein
MVLKIQGFSIRPDAEALFISIVLYQKVAQAFQPVPAQAKACGYQILMFACKLA